MTIKLDLPVSKKCFISTPMYGGVCLGTYTQSLIMFLDVMRQKNIPCAISMLFNESLIQRARNSLVNEFLKTDCTHLLFIDADISFNPNEIAAMFDFDLDVICGIYPKKEINWLTVESAVKAGVKPTELQYHTGAWVINLVDYKGEVNVPANEPLEIWNGGTGMMLIKREVFEKLKETVPSYVNDVVAVVDADKPRDRIYEFFATSIEPDTERLLSEDYHFCRIWRQAGGKIYAAPWVSLGHTGTYTFNGRLLQSAPQN
jgi:hypothetical protein